MSIIQRNVAGIYPLTESINKFLDEVFIPVGIKREGFNTPSVEFTEDKDNYYVKAEIPGMNKEEIDIEVKENELILSGEYKRKHEEKGEHVYRSEFRYGNFLRSIPLPDKIKTDQAKAAYKDGILEITLPKAEESKEKTVKLKLWRL